jgi:hypothetical protein
MIRNFDVKNTNFSISIDSENFKVSKYGSPRVEVDDYCAAIILPEGKKWNDETVKNLIESPKTSLSFKKIGVYFINPEFEGEKFPSGYYQDGNRIYLDGKFSFEIYDNIIETYDDIDDDFIKEKLTKKLPGIMFKNYQVFDRFGNFYGNLVVDVPGIDEDFYINISSSYEEDYDDEDGIDYGGYLTTVSIEPTPSM